MTLKQQLASRRHVLGGLLRMPAESLVELAGVAGLDFVLVDCEHGPADTLALQQHIITAEAHGLAVLVRVGRDDPKLILRALDLGASGIVLPHVETPEEAGRAVRAGRYPPLGERGVATYTRAGRFGAVSLDEHLRRAADTVVIVAMLETGPACERAEEIIAVDGIDAVMIGPTDLSASLGLAGGGAEPEVRRLMTAVHQTASRTNTPVMSILSDPLAAAWVPPGFVVFNLADVLLRTFRELVSAAATNRPPESAPDLG